MKCIDVGAEQLEGAAQDDGRRDAVHVVVAVDGDPFLPRDGGHDPIDGHAACRPAASGRAGDRGTGSGSGRASSGSPSPRWQSKRAPRGGTPDRRRQARRGALSSHACGCHRAGTDHLLRPLVHEVDPEPPHVPELVVAPRQPRVAVERAHLGQHACRARGRRARRPPPGRCARRRSARARSRR